MFPWNIYAWYEEQSGPVRFMLWVLWMVVALLPFWTATKISQDWGLFSKSLLISGGALLTLVTLTSRLYHLSKRYPSFTVFVTRWLLTVGIGMILGTPLWIYFWVHHMLNPQGFWQQIALGGIGLLTLGSIQLCLLFVFVVITITVWTTETSVLE
jgi:hypothetical protein